VASNAPAINVAIKRFTSRFTAFSHRVSVVIRANLECFRLNTNVSMRTVAICKQPWRIRYTDDMPRSARRDSDAKRSAPLAQQRASRARDAIVTMQKRGRRLNQKRQF
jgi:hypothetical protein